MSHDPSAINPKLLAAALLCGRKEARRLISDDGDALAEYWAEVKGEDREKVLMLADELEHGGVHLVSLTDGPYPDGLRALRSPPPFLFGIGNLGLLSERGLGFSGSRDATLAAIETTDECARAAHDAGRIAIAGFARGVDAAAHHGALAAGGQTVAVLPEGILNAKKHIELDDAIVAPGDDLLFISQFRPDTRWMVGGAMARNQTIVALSECLVMMSAQTTGGSVEAGKLALKAGAPVLAPTWREGPTPGVVELCGIGAHQVDSIEDFKERIGALDRELFLSRRPGGQEELF